MHLVISDIIPPKNISSEIIKTLSKKAPNLFYFLKHYKFKKTKLDPIKMGCTSLESVILELHGYLPKKDYILGSGLGPLAITNIKTNEPVWLLELVNLKVMNKNIFLSDPDELFISKEESKLLFESSEDIIKNFGLRIEFINAKTWRIFLSEKFIPTFYLSPQLAKFNNIKDIFNYTNQSKDWRLLLNHIQILLTNHIVNYKRTENFLLPINYIWLYGGGIPWNIKRLFKEDLVIIKDLEKSFMKNDWDEWLKIVIEIDSIYLKKYKNNSNIKDSIILLGYDSRVDIYLNKIDKCFLKWLKWNDWRDWWY